MLVGVLVIEMSVWLWLVIKMLVNCDAFMLQLGMV